MDRRNLLSHLGPNFAIRISREGDHLFEQATGDPKFEIFPESEKDFFLKVVDAQISFVTDSTATPRAWYFTRTAGTCRGTESSDPPYANTGLHPCHDCEVIHPGIHWRPFGKRVPKVRTAGLRNGC